MPQKKKKLDESLILRVPKNATLKQIYAIARKNFSAADLQRYTELDDCKPMDVDKLLAEMEATHKKESAKLKKSRR